MNSTQTRMRSLMLAALFAALTAVCSQIQIPLPAIPINLALFAVHLTGALLGPKYGSLSMLVYALLGGIGAPVFTGMTGGLGILLGKTGGYILGYILAALLVGLLSRHWGNSYGKLCIAMVAGTAACYTFGIIWYRILTGLGLFASLVACVFPFLIGDLAKILLAALLARRLQAPLIKRGWIL